MDYSVYFDENGKVSSIDICDATPAEIIHFMNGSKEIGDTKLKEKEIAKEIASAKGEVETWKLKFEIERKENDALIKMCNQYSIDLKNALGQIDRLEDELYALESENDGLKDRIKEHKDALTEERKRCLELRCENEKLKLCQGQIKKSES